VRTGLYIPQRAIVEKGLLGKVPIDAWLLLDYLRRWVTCKNLKKVQVHGLDFFWISYPHACRELPILFPRRPILRTQCNKMVGLVASLRENGLIDTRRFAGRCYVHIRERAQDLYVKPTDSESRLDEHGVTSIYDGADMQNHDDPITRSHDAKEQYKDEQHEKELHYTQNNYSDDEFECVKRQLETIFPKRNWSSTEIDLLKRQMPIPEWELKLITRFYGLPGPKNPFMTGKHFLTHEFLLARRRQTMRTLLEHWGDEIARALSFFDSWVGRQETESRGWGPGEMQPSPKATEINET
jgi:hypothetical protein